MDLRAIYANALITADGAQIVMHRRPETEAAHLAGLEAVRRAVIEECAKACDDANTYWEDDPGGSFAKLLRRMAEG